MSIISLGRIAEESGMELTDVGRAAVALEDGGLIGLRRTLSAGDPSPWIVVEVSGQARQLVGQWPTAEQFTEDLIRGLEAAAEEEPDPERKSRLRAVASSAGTVARSVITDVAAKVITRQLGV